jgi:predicted MFS family arabinose efflux permease
MTPFPSDPRAAVAAAFLLNGALFGAWASRVPAFAERLGLGPGALGIVLLAMAAGALGAFPLAGRLADRIGAGRASRRLAALYLLAFALLPLAGSVPALGLALLAFGAAQGGLDVAMNAWGAGVERRLGRPVLSGLHAMFSLGAGLGALTGAAAGAASLTPLWHFPALALGLAPLLLLRGPDAAPEPAEEEARFAWPRGPILLLGLLAFAASLGEGALADWGAVFLREAAAATEAQAALGYAVFSAAMVIARLCADRVVVRWGPERVARGAGLLAASGAALAILGAEAGALAALPGFALMGLGYAVAAPLAYSRAALAGGAAPGRAIAGVATLGYGGLLLGPPLLGLVAEMGSLPGAMALLGASALGLSVLAPVLAPRGLNPAERPGALSGSHLPHP